MCMAYMKQLIIYDQCNCFLSALPVPHMPEKHVCISQSEVKCAESKLFDFFRNDDLNKNCPIECERTDFTMSTSSANYPSEFYAQILGYQNSIKRKFEPTMKREELSKSENISFDSLKKSILKITVYYNDLTYTLVEEDPAITWDVLLGTIGECISLLIFNSLLKFSIAKRWSIWIFIWS